jgi:hypothetical protein
MPVNNTISPLCLVLSSAREGARQASNGFQRIFMLGLEHPLPRDRHLAFHPLCLCALSLVREGAS